MMTVFNFRGIISKYQYIIKIYIVEDSLRRRVSNPGVALLALCQREQSHARIFLMFQDRTGQDRTE